MAALTSKHLRQLRDSPLDGWNRVARAIELSGVTQMDIADAIGVPQPYVSAVARQLYQTITVENAHKFADYFGCTIDDLFPAREAVA